MKKEEKGITLIALVVTIVVLLILAGVSISMLTGENGIINQAIQAKDENEIAELQELVDLAITEWQTRDASGESVTLLEVLEDKRGKEFDSVTLEENNQIKIIKDGNEIIVDGNLYSTIKDVIGKEFTKTIQIKDDLGNTVVIPGGFEIAQDSGTKVEEGIVIEDIETANQFVWIPVGEYEVSTSLSVTGMLTNNLTRRQWGTTVNEVLIPTEVEGDVAVNGLNGNYYQGESSAIGEFLTQAKAKKGFYIGRYEQGEGNVVKAGVSVYNNITRDNAKIQSEALYNSEEDSVESELISSYAWDTALNFICQTNEEGYKLATVNSSNYGNMGTGTTLKNTGEYKQDNYSNINDFLGNVHEWTTGYTSYSGSSCVSRGGHYGGSTSVFAANRYPHNASYSGSVNFGFRTQLYIK